MEHKKLKNHTNLHNFVLILFFIFGLMLPMAAVTVSAVDFDVTGISVAPLGDCPAGAFITVTVSKIDGTDGISECAPGAVYLDGDTEPLEGYTYQICILALDDPQVISYSSPLANISAARQ